MPEGLILTEAASPGTPGAATANDWLDTDRKRKTIDSAGVISTLNNDGLKNRNVLANGALYIQQRVAVAATAIPGVSTTSRAGKVADRWAVTTGNATTTQWTRTDTSAAPETALGARYYGRITQITNAAKFIFSQFIANEDMHHLRGQKVRLSCKLKQIAGSNAVYRLGLLQLAAAGTVDTPPAFISAIGADGVEPTWGTNLLAITPDASPTGENGTITGVALSITSTAGWVRSSAVFTVPTDCKNLVFVLYRNTTGAANDSVGIAELQMTVGPDLVDWVPLPTEVDLAMCQRYFCKTFALNTVPVTNAGINTGEAKNIAGKAGATAGAGVIPWRFPVKMRTTPATVTLFNPAAANALMRNLTGAADMGATAATAQLDESTVVIATGVAATAVGDHVGIHITADAEFAT